MCPDGGHVPPAARLTFQFTRSCSTRAHPGRALHARNVFSPYTSGARMLFGEDWILMTMRQRAGAVEGHTGGFQGCSATPPGELPLRVRQGGVAWGFDDLARSARVEMPEEMISICESQILWCRRLSLGYGHDDSCPGMP